MTTQAQKTTTTPLPKPRWQEITELFCMIASFAVLCGVILWAIAAEAHPPTLVDNGTPPASSEPGTVVPEPTGRIIQPVSVLVGHQEGQAFLNILKRDIARHNGIYMRAEQPGSHVTQVPQGYVERLQPLINASTDGRPDAAYMDWTEAPPSIGTLDTPADVRVVFTIREAKPILEAAAWFIPATTGLAIISATLLGALIYRDAARRRGNRAPPDHQDER